MTTVQHVHVTNSSTGGYDIVLDGTATVHVHERYYDEALATARRIAAEHFAAVFDGTEDFEDDEA
jgi:antitoxin component of MazEF toxin-antitoxin module